MLKDQVMRLEALLTKRDFKICKLKGKVDTAEIAHNYTLRN